MKLAREHRLYRLLAALAVGLVCTCAQPAQAQESLEYQVKAAFLYNFTKFVTWPRESFATDEAPLSVCVVGQDPFDGELSDMFKDRMAQGRPLGLLVGSEVVRLESCNVVFVPRGEDDRVARILQSMRGRGVLTVGESQSFSDAGGMIRLVLEAKKVRFDVNVVRTTEDGLKVSSQLLKLARNVTQ
jgi:hypothetical protein